MAKLIFRYGTMSSGKSLDLFKVAYNYEENNCNVLIYTSSIDNRSGEMVIASRTGLKRDAVSLSKTDDPYNILKQYMQQVNKKIDCVLVDEAQFLNKNQIYQLANIVDELNIPVLAFGLRSDFKLETFEGSRYLLALADDIEEIKTICGHCKTKKAIINARKNQNGKILSDGEQVMIGGNDLYIPLCRKCYNQLIK